MGCRKRERLLWNDWYFADRVQLRMGRSVGSGSCVDHRVVLDDLLVHFDLTATVFVLVGKDVFGRVHGIQRVFVVLSGHREVLLPVELHPISVIGLL